MGIGLRDQASVLVPASLILHPVFRLVTSFRRWNARPLFQLYPFVMGISGHGVRFQGRRG